MQDDSKQKAFLENRKKVEEFNITRSNNNFVQ